MYASLLRWGRLLIAGVLIFFLVKRLYKLLAEIEVEEITFQSPLWLIVSLMLLIVYLSMLGIPWFFSYRAGSGKQISFLSGWTFFQLSQFGRYPTGKNWTVCVDAFPLAQVRHREDLCYACHLCSTRFSVLLGMYPRISYITACRNFTPPKLAGFQSSDAL